MKKILLSCALGLLPLTAFSQTPSTLEMSYQAALNDQAVIQSQLSVMKPKKRSTACLYHQLKAEQKSNQWFLDHYAHYQELFQRVKNELVKVQKVIRAIDAHPISVLPIQTDSRKSSEVELTFSDLVQYFNRYNEQVKDTSLNVSHSQVVAAMEAMTKLLNASLREPDAVYALKFFKLGSSYRLMLSVKFLDESIPELKISLLNQPVLGDAAVWSALGTGNLNEVPRDAAMRLNYFLREDPGSCKKFLALNVTAIEKNPYLSMEALQSKVVPVPPSALDLGQIASHMQVEVKELESSTNHEVILNKISHLQHDVIQMKIHMKHPDRRWYVDQVQQLKELVEALQEATDSQMQLYR